MEILKFKILLVNVFLVLICTELKGQADTVIYGRAGNTKFRACIETKDSQVYYIEDLKFWDTSVLHKNVKVTGKVIVKILQKPKDESKPEARITGPNYKIIREAKF